MTLLDPRLSLLRFQESPQLASIHHGGGDPALRRLGVILRALLPSLGGTSLASYLVVDERVERGFERCSACGHTENMGAFTLRVRLEGEEITLPYIAVHALADHGEAHVRGELHRGEIVAGRIARLVHFEEREAGRRLEAFLAHAEPVPRWLEIEPHPQRGFEVCTQCSKPANMGSFVVRREVPRVEMSMPYAAVHALAVHGDRRYAGTLHTGEVALADLLAALGEEREAH